MRRGIITLLLGVSILFIGCSDNTTTDIESNNKETNAKEEVINYSEIAEEYNPKKEYSRGDIVSYTGEITKMHWFDTTINSYYINGCGTKWKEVDGYSVENFAKQLPFGGKVKVIGERSSAGEYFTIKEFEILEINAVTLDDYISERAKMDVNGISREEANQLNEWCNENEECKSFENILDDNIYVLYPELNN